MDGLEFVSGLVGTTAWPAAVVTCVFVFRRQVRGLIPRLRTFEGGPSGIKATFEELTPLSEVISHVAVTSGDERAGTARAADSSWSPVIDRAMSNPREAVIDAWSLLDQQLNRLAARVDPAARDWLHARQALSALDQGPVMLAAARELKRLRDVTLHSSEVPAPLDAVRYVTVSGDLARGIEALSAAGTTVPTRTGATVVGGEE